MRSTNLSISNYGDPYAQTCKHVVIGSFRIYFSYSTPIAFQHGLYEMGRLFIRENEWGTTSGRHLNLINSDKSIRLPSDKFIEHLEKALRLPLVLDDES